MVPKRHMAIALILMLTFVLVSCSGSSLLVDHANSKQSAAKYYYDQGDYRNARKSSSEALVLWKMVKERKLRSYPEWAVDNNISACEELLEKMPTTASGSIVTVVPIRIVKGQIIVQARLNQNEKGVFVVDTGAERTVITPELAHLLKIDSNKNNKKMTLEVIGGQLIKASSAALDEIQIGDAIVKHLLVGITPIMPDQPNIDGLLGADFLANFTVTVDHGLRKLKLVAR